MKIIQNILLFLTKVIEGTGNLEKKEYQIKKSIKKRLNLKSNKLEYYLFSNPKRMYSGKLSIFHNLLINKESIERNKKINNYFEAVLFHELGHKKDILTIPFTIIALYFGLNAFCAILIFFLNFIKFILPFYEIILGIIITLFLFGLTSWILEIRAEYYTAKALGFKNWKKTCLNAIKSKKSFFTEFIIRLTHPPIKWLIKIFSINIIKKRLI